MLGRLCGDVGEDFGGVILTFTKGELRGCKAESGIGRRSAATGYPAPEGFGPSYGQEFS